MPTIVPAAAPAAHRGLRRQRGHVGHGGHRHLLRGGAGTGDRGLDDAAHALDRARGGTAGDLDDLGLLDLDRFDVMDFRRRRRF
ncbi:hypothetical protein, partial [Klebsiella pneumoniae]